MTPFVTLSGILYNKGFSNVLAAGGLFFPLVVESLGLWTPSSLKTLKVIASKSSSLNGTPLSLAVSYLHQGLSIRLWGYNAQMLLSRFLDISEVIDFPTYPLNFK